MAKLTPAQELARDLIRCPSVTPHEGGALDLLEGRLAAAGFNCHRLPFGEGEERIDNLFTVWGEGDPHFCFAGHTDVVPAGDENDWSHPPFGGDVDGGILYGRGAEDMKGAVAAFATAAIDHIEKTPPKTGRISLLITGDEEGVAIHGTRPVLDWIDGKKMMPDAFLVGEPTNSKGIGDTVKNGRRGSLSCILTVEGIQGHSAYPHKSDNPLPRLMAMLTPLAATGIDDGNDDFEPSTAAITSIDTGNPALNVTPQRTEARFNIRYSSDHTADSLKSWLTEHFNAVGGTWSAEWFDSAAPFITKPGPYTEIVTAAITDITGSKPSFSTSGGTSDARFIAPFAEVVEFGLVGRTMHQVDENISLEDLTTLTEIYGNILQRYFAAA
jgi:succinyl-diaminopimelate desuccinylase